MLNKFFCITLNSINAIVVQNISGEKAFVNLSLQPKLHAIGRKPFSEALSTKAVLGRQRSMETIVERTMLRLEGFAEAGQV